MFAPAAAKGSLDDQLPVQLLVAEFPRLRGTSLFGFPAARTERNGNRIYVDGRVTRRIDRRGRDDAALCAQPASPTVISRPLAGLPPAIDLSLGYNEANKSPLLKAIVAKIGDLKFGVPRA